MPSSILRHLSFIATLRATLRRTVLLASVGVFLIALSTASPVSAAGGIEVDATSQSVIFPGNVDLSVTARGDDEIVAVRIFYRTAGSRIWAYAYPSFVPANRITASINLTGEVPTYQPPGTEIEYYYEISDSKGNMLRTEPATVVYEDTRFDWDKVTIGPLTLQYYDQSNSTVQAVARQLESDLEKLQTLLQLDQPNAIKGIIYSNRSDTLEAFPQQSRTTTEQQIFQGFAFSERGLFLGLGMDRGLIVHEVAHLMFGQAVGDRALPTPAWLDEGFASYMDPSSTVLSGPSLNSRTIPLRAMNTVTGTPHTINAFYQKSLSVVAFMIDEFGEAGFQRFVAELNGGATVDASLMNVYGFDTDGLDARWAGEAPGAPAPAPAAPGRGPASKPSPILFFDSWLLGGLMLLVIVALSIQLVASRLRPARDPEEGLQPWEDPDLWEEEDDDDDDHDGPSEPFFR
ncbi:MAG: peptidase MA family metallohydrolase [Chloroflexi bacterium]|nr:peptidase MA family metallohydrolase [Chloroflexota bacterium]MDA1271378.1 peptidase MA family metallohydrolase [Chloroflexota bacterium]